MEKVYKIEVKDDIYVLVRSKIEVVRLSKLEGLHIHSRVYNGVIPNECMDQEGVRELLMDFGLLVKPIVEDVNKQLTKTREEVEKKRKFGERVESVKVTGGR